MYSLDQELAFATQKVREQRAVISTLQSDLAAVKAEQDAVFKEAHFLATAIHRKHYHEVTQWKPLDYTAGLISQIDNMAAGLSLDLAAAREELARARSLVSDFIDDDDTPDANCSCHINPPCNDCVNNGWRRELITRAKALCDSAHKGEEG